MLANFKTPVWRSKKYLKWVKSLPCCVCKAPADDPHHIKGVGHLSGVGMTAPDQFTIPLCREHHNWIHTTPPQWHIQWEWVARTLAKAVQDGILGVQK